MSKKTMKPISLAIGTAFVTSLAISNVSAEADVNTNPFAMDELSSGYMQLAASYAGNKSDKEGKCGEGKCGEKKDAGEGKCGGEKSEKEGKCGEGKCGGEKAEKEGKCGEGKCGGEMDKNMEGKCGGDKADEEGKCGEGKCGESK